MQKLGDLSKLNTAIGGNLVEAMNALGRNVTILFQQVGGLSEQTTGDLNLTLPNYIVQAKEKTETDFIDVNINQSTNLNINEIGSSLKLNLSSVKFSTDTVFTPVITPLPSKTKKTIQLKFKQQEFSFRQTNDIHLPINTDTVFINGMVKVILGQKGNITLDANIPIKLKIKYEEPNFIITILESDIVEIEVNNTLNFAINVSLLARNFNFESCGISFINSETFKGYTDEEQ